MTALSSFAGAFLALMAQKALLEPLAKRLGRRAINHLISPCCLLLDKMLDQVGWSLNPEQVVRDYLELSEDNLTPKQVDQVIEEVFAKWDIRVWIETRSER